MKITISYDQLYSIEQDIHRLSGQSPALAVFMRDKFNRFLKATGLRRDLLHHNLKEIRRKYILFNEKDLPISVKDEATGNLEWTFIEGEVEREGIMVSNKDAYNKEVTDFLNLSFEITF